MTDTPRKKTTTKKPMESKSLVKTTLASGWNRKWFFITALIVQVLLVIAVIYIFLAVNKTASTGIQQGLDTTQQLNRLDARVRDLDSNLSKTIAAADQLAQSQQSLNDALHALQKERPDSDQYWTLHEIEYLVLIAMHRLQLEQDTNTAIAALQVADRRLRDMANPVLIPLREQLASDINALKGVNQPDVTGMAAYLTDMVKRVDSLPLNNTLGSRKPAPGSTSDVSKAETDQKSWHKLPAMVWKELKSLVVIKRKDDNGTAFIMPNEEYYLFQNLKLELVNARLALLRRDTETMNASIGLVELWIRSYFDQDSAAVMNILESLEKMQGADLKPSLPDIRRSLEVVREIIQSS